MSSDASAPEVLWAGRFRLEKAGDEVEEIKLDVPARITQVLISDVGGQSKAPPVLKVFARDLYSVSGARFAPLCSSTISCAEQSTSTYRTEPITTNHVIIRGRYSNLAFSLLGYLDHDKSCAEQSFSEDLLPLEGERLFKTTLVPIGRTSTLDYSQVHSPVSPLALKTSPGSSKQIPGALPLPALPSAFARVLHNALLYYGEVRRSHKLILTNRPGQLLKPLQEIADAVCESLKGKTDTLSKAASVPFVRQPHPPGYPQPAEDPSLPIPDWNDYIVGMAVSWCNLLASPSSFLPSDMAVGMAGLHASLVLCTTAPGCAAFIAGGGIEALVELLMVPNIPSDMARYCIALCELAVVSGTNTGCEVLLGWWRPPHRTLKEMLPPPAPMLPPPPQRQLSAGDVKPEREGGPSPKLEERVKEEEADGHGEGGEGDEGDQEYNTYSVDEYESGGGEQEEGAEEEKGEEDEEMREDEHKEGGEAQGEDVDEHEEQDEGMRITDPDHPLYEYDEPDYSNDPGVGEEMIQEIDDAGGNEEDEKVMYDNGVDEGNDEGNEGDDTRNRLDNISEADKEAKQASVRSGSHACAQRDGSPAERGGDGREAGGERRQGGHPKPNPDDMEAKKDSKDGSQRHRDTDREAGPRQRDAHREKTRKRIRSVSKSHSPSRSPSRSRSRSRSPSRSRSRSHSRSRGQPSSRSPSRSRRKAHSSHSRHRSRQRSRSRERRRSSGRKHSHSRRSGSPSPAGSRSRSRSRSGRAEKVKRVESGTQSRDERGVKREVREHSAPARSAYGSLLQLCTLRRRPDVAAAARRTLQCLQAYEVLCRFQRNVNKVVFSRGGPKQEEQKQLSAQEELLCVREACMALSELPGLCIAPTADEQELQKAEDIGKGLPPSTEADTTVLQLMHSCSLFGSIATLSHASASLASQLKAAAAKGGGSPTAPGPGGRPSMTPARQAHLQLQQLPIFHAQMVGTTRTLMSLLMSTTPGLRIISASQKQVAALMHALDPSREDAQGSELGTASAFGLSDASGILQDGGGAAAALAAEKRLATLNEQHLLVSSMREVLVAQAAVHDLETRTMGDPAAAAAVLSLVAAVSAPPPSPACTAALVTLSQSPGAIRSLLRLMRHRAVLLEAAGLPVGGLSRRQASNSALDEDEDDLEGGMLWEDLKQGARTYPEALYAHAVVLELVKQCHPDLIAGWVGMADAILEAARSELEALSSTRNGLASSFGGTAPHDGQYGDDRSKRALREMIGRVEAVVLFQDQGLHGVLTHLDHVLVPQLMSKDIVVGGVTKKGLKKEVENRATMTLLKAPERCGKLSMLLRLMALKVGGGEDKQLSMMAFRNSALQVLERALRTGTHALLTSIADGQWAYLRGDAISELDRLRNHQQGSAILAAACHATLSMLVGLSKAGTQKLCNSGMPEAMIRAHAQLCLEKDSLATALGASRTSGDLLQARQALSAALGVWVDAGWGPNAISLLFSVRPSTGVDLDLTRGDENSVDGKAASSVAAANIDAAATNQSPSQIYTTSCLLGDLLPPEWPQPQRQPQGGAAPKHVLGPPAPPECPARRAALASAMELCQTPLRRLLHFGASSESRVIRCSLVRLMSRAAGLSASMGMFMSQPLIEHLQAIVKGTGPVSDGRRVLEMLVPLSAKPAMKAGFLELKAVSTLARFLHKLVHRLSEEGTDGVASCTMALEALTILCNPDVALNIGLPLEDRLQNDTPSVTEASTLVAALLACLPNLASNVGMARNLLLSPVMGLSTNVAGRNAIRQGSTKWYFTQAGGGGGSKKADAEQTRMALTWASGKLWDCGDRLKEVSDQHGVGPVAHEVSKMLDRVADSIEADAPVSIPAPSPAPTRFTEAMQAAVDAVKDKDKDTDKGAGKESVEPSFQLLATDPTTQAFWRYCRARGSTRTTLLARKLTKWEVAGEEASGPASQLFSEGLCKRKPGREVSKQPAPKAVAEKTVRISATDSKPAGGGAADVPTVTATRRFPYARIRAGSGSRPASRHVDDYQTAVQQHRGPSHPTLPGPHPGAPHPGPQGLGGPFSVQPSHPSHPGRQGHAGPSLHSMGLPGPPSMQVPTQPHALSSPPTFAPLPMPPPAGMAAHYRNPHPAAPPPPARLPPVRLAPAPSGDQDQSLYEDLFTPTPKGKVLPPRSHGPTPLQPHGSSSISASYQHEQQQQQHMQGGGLAQMPPVVPLKRDASRDASQSLSRPASSHSLDMSTHLGPRSTTPPSSTTPPPHHHQQARAASQDNHMDPHAPSSHLPSHLHALLPPPAAHVRTFGKSITRQQDHGQLAPPGGGDGSGGGGGDYSASAERPGGGGGAVYSAPVESTFDSDNLYDSLYDAGAIPQEVAGPSSGGGAGSKGGVQPPPASLEPAQAQPQPPSAQQPAPVPPAANALTPATIMALLKDPAKLRLVLQSNPELARVLQKFMPGGSTGM